MPRRMPLLLALLVALPVAMPAGAQTRHNTNAPIDFSADQILSLPLTVIGGLGPLGAFRRGRAATDPHWLHALGLTLVLLGMVLAGFLVLLAGLVVALPVAACTLTAAYQQLFEPVDPSGISVP